eukprot:4604694-Pyramimonas_sp.AAC.1
MAASTPRTRRSTSTASAASAASGAARGRTAGRRRPMTRRRSQVTHELFKATQLRHQPSSQRMAR